jgi:hypothetical protein
VNVSYAIRSNSRIYHLLRWGDALTLCGLSVSQLMIGERTASLHPVRDKPLDRTLCKRCGGMAKRLDSEIER